MPASGAGAQASSAVLDATGYVTARRQATVSSKITGKVSEVFIEEGLVVEAGQLLATLDSSTQQVNFDLARAQYAATKSRLKEVEVQREEALLEHQRMIELEQKKLASKADLDRVRLAVDALDARLAGLAREIDVALKLVDVQQQQLDDMKITAPFGGVVIAKAAQPGEMISPVSAGGGFTRTGICTIVDMSSLEIEVDVNESYINRVSPGQPVSATLNSYPDWQIPSEVITIIPTADRSKATVRVRIGFIELDPRILPDMGVRVAFLQETAPEAEKTELTGVFVPASAVYTLENRNVIYLVVDNRIVIREVRLGPRQGNNRNVIQGITSGDTLVTSLDAERASQLQEGAIVRIE